MCLASVIRAVGLVGVTVIALCSAGKTSAAMIFSDDFNRPNSNAVGNDWVELFNWDADDVAITSNRLRLRDIGATIQRSISTLGFDSVKLAYDWSPLAPSEDADFFRVYWRVGTSGSFNILDGHTLGGTEGVFTSELKSLGASAANRSVIQIRIALENPLGGVLSDEGVLIDDFVLSGNPMPGFSQDNPILPVELLSFPTSEAQTLQRDIKTGKKGEIAKRTAKRNVIAGRRFPPGTFTYTFPNAPSRRWFDPPVTDSFTYEMTSGNLFTSILDFPTGFTNPFDVSVGGTLLGSFTPGQSLDFVSRLGHGVSSFTVSSISASEFVDAFPLQLAFDAPVASFTMTYNIPPTAVPEPATVTLSIIGIASLFVVRMARRRRLTGN